MTNNEKSAQVGQAFTAATLLGMAAAQQHRKRQEMERPRTFAEYLKTRYPAAAHRSPFEVGMGTAQSVFMTSLLSSALER